MHQITDPTKKILVTGGSGYMGSYAIQSLLRTGFDVTATYHQHCPKDSTVPFIHLDIFDRQNVATVLDKVKPTHILHLAWSVPPKEFWHSPDNVKWCDASVDLFDIFCQKGGKHFIGAGSVAEYDWQTDVFDETKTPLQPQTIYGQSKKRLYDTILKKRDVAYPTVRLSWARIGYFFGQGEPSQKLFSVLAHKIKHNDKITLTDKNLARDYAHVRHLGDALAAIALHPDDAVINVGGGSPIKALDVIDFMGAEIGQTPIVDFSGYVSAVKEPLVLYSNIDRLRKLVGAEYNKDVWQDVKGFLKDFHE